MRRRVRKDASASSYYETNAAELASAYEGVTFDTVHPTLLRHVPARPARVLDVGSGSGRDAAWLARRGLDVVAVEPSDALRGRAKSLHPDARITWIRDHLPQLRRVISIGRRFDLILVSAVWMHVHPNDQARALSCLRDLLSDDSVLYLSLRQGEASSNRGFHNGGDPGRLVELASSAVCLECVEADRTPDALGRPDVNWTSLVLRGRSVPATPHSSPAPAISSIAHSHWRT